MRTCVFMCAEWVGSTGESKAGQVMCMGVGGCIKIVALERSMLLGLPATCVCDRAPAKPLI